MNPFGTEFRDFHWTLLMLIFLFRKSWRKKKTGALILPGEPIEEYKKFVYLCCILPNGASPSKIIDKV